MVGGLTRRAAIAFLGLRLLSASERWTLAVLMLITSATAISRLVGPRAVASAIERLSIESDGGLRQPRL
jgi:hypothetical protein